MIFARHDATGKVVAIGEVPDSMIELQEGNIFQGTIDGATQYVVGGVAIPRPAVSSSISATTVPADGTTALTLSGVPNGATVTVSGPLPTMTEKADGTSIVLTFAIVGTYTIAVDAFPQQDFKVTINAT